MAKVLFPAGDIIEYSDLDLEDLESHSSHWNIEHTHMETGHQEGKLLAVHTPHMQFASAVYARKFMSSGDYPAGSVLLLYSPSDVTYNFQNRSVTKDEIIILGKGAKIDILTKGEINIRTLVIEEEFFYDSFYDFFDESPEKLIESKRLLLKPEVRDDFIQNIGKWISYLAYEYPSLAQKPSYEKLESEILQNLFNTIVFTSKEKKREKFETKKVRDLLHQNLDQEIDIALMLKEMDIGESQLHHSFKKEYGMTPKKYLQQLRFHAVRKELRALDPKRSTVEEIARKYHFYHMGHFANAYKTLFGEMPSSTLKSSS